jgi:hypothetical protein
MMDTFVKILAPRFNLNIGRFSLPVPYFEAFLVVLLVFVLILSFAQFRRHTVNWSFKGIVFGTFFGFMLALIIEGFLIIKGGTILTSILGWTNAPAPISIALDAGRAKLTQVLGVSVKSPSSIVNENSNVSSAIQFLQNLNPNDIKNVKAILCK